MNIFLLDTEKLETDYVLYMLSDASPMCVSAQKLNFSLKLDIHCLRFSVLHLERVVLFCFGAELD